MNAMYALKRPQQAENSCRLTFENENEPEKAVLFYSFMKEHDMTNSTPSTQKESILPS